MELDWLQTFAVAAQTLNFHRTASILHVAQPTVSLHIHKLEQNLGLPLFERKGRNVVLSAAGRRYLSHAQAVLKALQDGRDDLLRWQAGYVETLRIGASPLVANTILPRWIQRYTATHPDTQFSILVKDSEEVVENVTFGEVDIGFSRMAVAHGALQCVQLYVDPIIFVGPTRGQDVDGAPRTPSELFAEYPVISRNHPEYWDELLVSLRKMYPDVRTMEISQVHVTLHWIIENMGVSFLPASTVRRELLRGNVAEVYFPDFTLPTTSTYLLLNPSGISPAVQSFADFVQVYMKEREF